MPSYHCKQCDDFYPRDTDYSTCPSCESACEKSAEKPDIPYELAEYRYLWRKRVNAFEDWCKENREDDPDAIVIEVPDAKNHGMVMYAYGVVDMMRRNIPQYDLGLLFVFLGGGDEV